MGYVNAIEKRLEWLEWVKTIGRASYGRNPRTSRDLPAFEHPLGYGDTFFMNTSFCELVDYARQTIPDDLEFESSWLPSKGGWLWLDKPFDLPKVEGEDDELTKLLGGAMRISAIGWYQNPDTVDGHPVMGSDGKQLADGSVTVCCYQDLTVYGNKDSGFGMWSVFVLQPGEKVLDRIRKFESFAKESAETGAYESVRESDMLHEIRWVYTALHLMSQKLTVVREERAERPVRRRLEKARIAVSPMFKVVMLRRMEEARKKEASGEPVDWKYRWLVHGHGRWQYYPSIKDNKWIWIDDYVKGPENKPMKPPSHTVFRVER